MQRKALVILSGGQDSATCLFWALNRFDSVEAITFNYGQQHSVEVEVAKTLCAGHKVPQKIVDISFLNQLVDSGLIEKDGDVNKINALGLPNSFVPNRNQIFITLAHAYAQKIGADALVGGMCQTDYSGYPDCRNEFLQNLIYVTNNGSGLGNPKDFIKLETPLMWLTKSETFQLAYDLGALEEVIEHSHTCYKGDRDTKHEWGYGCGDCPACKLRKQGFEDYKKTVR